MDTLSRITDEDLLALMPKLVSIEHASSADVIEHLVEIDRRQLYLEEARGKSKRDIEELIAKLLPKPDVPSSFFYSRTASRPGILGAATGGSVAPKTGSGATLAPRSGGTGSGATFACVSRTEYLGPAV